MIESLMTGTGQDIVLFLMGQDDRETKYDLLLHKESRSLNANAYFHVLCDKLRKKMNVSFAYMKNQLITSYGQILYIDDAQTEPMYYKTNAPEEYVQELETMHMKCVNISTENGKAVYFYKMYRGSHTYNTAEMSQLISGTVQECEQQGIVTLTPDEITRLVNKWKVKGEKE